jgi:TetR/AcrR family transcriptional regulator, tetracycline repressor protein
VPGEVSGAGKRTKRPGRPRRGESRLDRRSILASALVLVDRHGLEALSMRRLAAELDVDPMSLYHHVPNKAAIVSGLVEAVFSEMAFSEMAFSEMPFSEMPFSEMPQPPATGGRWEERVRSWARAYRDLAQAHPNLVLQIVTDSAAASEAAVLISEPLYAALDAAGLPPRAVVDAAGAVVDFVNGYTLAWTGRAADSAHGPNPMTERLDALDPERVRTMRRTHAAVSAETSPSTAPTGFEAGVEILIRGIGALAGPPGSAEGCR